MGVGAMIAIVGGITMGMLLMGVAFVQGLAVAASSVVAVTVLASLTLLPALLGFAGGGALVATVGTSGRWGPECRLLPNDLPGELPDVAHEIEVPLEVRALEARVGGAPVVRRDVLGARQLAQGGIILNYHY